MAEYRPVCHEGDIPAGGARLFVLDGKEVALFHTAGAYYAMENTCLHAGGPLHEGALSGTTVECPWHQWQFDVTSGRCSLNPMVSLATYPVRVRDGAIEIQA